MALQKSIQHSTGVPVSYWRVTKVLLDYERKFGAITLSGYYNQQARLDNKRSLDARQITVSAELFDTHFSSGELDNNTNPVKQAYIYIKTTPEFSDVTDV